MSLNKSELRKKLIAQRNNLTSEQVRTLSCSITDNLKSYDKFAECKTVFAYINMKNEAQTIPLIEYCWEMGKKVAAPVCLKNGEMYFEEIKMFEPLKITKFGVIEPQKGREFELLPQDGDIFIVPGSVFDIKGNRIGYGAGFYDRYFAKHSKGIKIGFAFDFQVLENIERQEHDINMDVIVTERRTLLL